MIKLHTKGCYRGKPIVSLMNPKEHWDYLMDTYNILHSDCGCWVSDIGTVKDGYPTAKHRGRNVQLTSLVVAIKSGCEVADIQRDPTSPGRAMSGAHSCSNVWCINPDHIRVATNADNAYDGDRGKANPIAVRGVSRGGHVIEADSFSEAAKATGFSLSSISVASKGEYCKRSKHGGTYWYKGYRWSRAKPS